MTEVIAQEENTSIASFILSRQKTPVQYAFTYLSASDTRRQYPRSLRVFFVYLRLPEYS